MDKSNVMESVEPCSCQYSLKADLRLNGWLLVATVTHLVVLYVVKRQTEWSPLSRGLLVLAPLIPGLLYVRSWMRFIRRLDELQRRIQVEAFLFAALGTVIVGAVVGSLNAHGIPTGSYKHGLGLGASFMAMLYFWSIGWAIAKRRYK